MTNVYCPICERLIEPENMSEVAGGVHEGFIYVHINKPHSDSDIEALENGIQ